MAAAREARVTQIFAGVTIWWDGGTESPSEAGRVGVIRFGVSCERCVSAVGRAGYVRFCTDVLQVSVPVGQYHGTFVITGFTGIHAVKDRLDLNDGLSFYRCV